MLQMGMGLLKENVNLCFNALGLCTNFAAALKMSLRILGGKSDKKMSLKEAKGRHHQVEGEECHLALSDWRKSEKASVYFSLTDADSSLLRGLSC